MEKQNLSPHQELAQDSALSESAFDESGGKTMAPPPFQLAADGEDTPSDSPPAASQPANNTGMPDNLKAGLENLSGFSMDDVRVHYNSSEPAKLQAHAYAQGNQIHLGPGQEKYLPHEAWHVVQQKQGRVKATMQMDGGVAVNDDPGLEREADVMGGKAEDFRKGKIEIAEIRTAKISRDTIQLQLDNSEIFNILITRLREITNTSEIDQILNINTSLGIEFRIPTNKCAELDHDVDHFRHNILGDVGDASIKMSHVLKVISMMDRIEKTIDLNFIAIRREARNLQAEFANHQLEEIINGDEQIGLNLRNIVRQSLGPKLRKEFLTASEITNLIISNGFTVKGKEIIRQVQLLTDAGNGGRRQFECEQFNNSPSHISLWIRSQNWICPPGNINVKKNNFLLHIAPLLSINYNKTIHLTLEVSPSGLGAAQDPHINQYNPKAYGYPGNARISNDGNLPSEVNEEGFYAAKNERILHFLNLLWEKVREKSNADYRN